MDPLSRSCCGCRLARPLVVVVGVVAMSVVSSSALRAQDRTESVHVELFTGVAWNVRTPLVIRLDGDRHVVRARYSTRPFRDAPYYSYRLGHASVGREIDVEMLHHKLYLENPVPPVSRLEVSHGYNLPTVNVAPQAAGWRWRAGLGIVVAHPEGIVGGRPVGARRTFLGGGYHIAGIATQLSLGRRYALSGGAVAMTASPELRLTAAVARVPLEGGALTVPNVALHALGGLGARRTW